MTPPVLDPAKPPTATPPAGEPDPAGGIEAALRVGEAGLLDSLARLASGAVPAPDELRERAVRMAAALEGRPPGGLDPVAWLAYYRLGQPLAGGTASPFPWADDPARLAELLRRPVPKGSVIAWGDEAIYTPLEWEAILALFQEGGDFVPDLEPPDEATYQSLRHAVGEVRALVGPLSAGLGGDLDRLLGLTILARPGPRTRRSGGSFGGATTFFLRGASLIHASAGLTLPGLLERLVHEAAHAELFVIAQDALLCHNPDDERHAVRIRRDPRPMNGILHSLHVTGRVCETLDAVLADGLPWRSDRRSLLEDCRQLRRQQAALGGSSLEAVRRHGRLTPLGQAVCDASARRLRGAGDDG